MASEKGAIYALTREIGATVPLEGFRNAYFFLFAGILVFLPILINTLVACH